jgi:hypothetical protein
VDAGGEPREIHALADAREAAHARAGYPEYMTGRGSPEARYAAHVRIVPFSARLHSGVMSGPFVILRFPANGDGQESEPPVAYVEGFTGTLTLYKPSDVQRYASAYADVAAAALDDPASRSLILRAAKCHAS